MAHQYTPNLGHLCDNTARRDAVHIAVAPVVAVHQLKPGERVRLRFDGCAVACEPDDTRTIGVVDPFLREPVEEGVQFWLFLFPGTVTSLRHVWTHPAFAPKVPERTA